MNGIAFSLNKSQDYGYYVINENKEKIMRGQLHFFRFAQDG